MADSAAVLRNQVASGVGIGLGDWVNVTAAAVIEEGTMIKLVSGLAVDGGDVAGAFGGVATGESRRSGQIPGIDTVNGITTGAASDLTQLRRRRRGIYAFTPVNTADAAAALGSIVTMSSNQEVDLAAGTTNDEQCGRIVGWQVSGVNWVAYAAGAKALVDIGGFC